MTAKGVVFLTFLFWGLYGKDDMHFALLWELLPLSSLKLETDQRCIASRQCTLYNGFWAQRPKYRGSAQVGVLSILVREEELHHSNHYGEQGQYFSVPKPFLGGYDALPAICTWISSTPPARLGEWLFVFTTRGWWIFLMFSKLDTFVMYQGLYNWTEHCDRCTKHNLLKNILQLTL
jgi:hypothetical protein